MTDKKDRTKSNETSPAPAPSHTPLLGAPLLYAQWRNDNWMDPARRAAGMLSLGNTDGGIVSNQSSLGASFPIQRGLLKGSGVTVEGSTTTFSGWAGVGGKSTEGDYRGKSVTDGYQAPKGERQNLAIGLHKSPGNRLDIALRGDVAAVTGNSPVQDGWHGMSTAYYYRTRFNKVADTYLAQGEVTAAYHLPIHRHKTDYDMSLFGGTSIGNGYQGGMAGIGVSVGSAHASFPVTQHSAQFGHTNLTYAASTSLKPKQWKFDAYIAGFLSNNRDYRTTTAKDNPLTTDRRTDLVLKGERFGSEFQGNAVSTRSTGGPIVTNLLPQYNVESYTLATAPFVVPGPIHHYEFNPLNAEIGLGVQYQLSHRVGLHFNAKAFTNPVTPVVNDVQGSVNRQYNELSAIHIQDKALSDITHRPDVTNAPGLDKTYIELMSNYQFDQNELMKLKNSASTVKPAESPPILCDAMLGITVQLGGKKKSPPTR